jgi:multicomponent Na+:H+ antiporter subunit G
LLSARWRVLDVIGGVLLFLGLTLMTISLYGVLRQPETYGQLHAQGLATGPGVIAVLTSSIGTENAANITFAVLAIAFVTLTSPVSAMRSPGPLTSAAAALTAAPLAVSP